MIYDILSTVPENIYFGSVTALENLPNNDARPIPEPGHCERLCTLYKYLVASGLNNRYLYVPFSQTESIAYSSRDPAGESNGEQT